MTAEEIIERMKQFEADRSNWDNRWQDCADYAMPQNNQITRKRAKGEAEEDLFDTTAEESNIQLAAGLYSYMFPTDSRAFVLEAGDDETSKIEDVKQWLEKVTRILHKHLIGSNFRQSFFEFLKSLGCFGTACEYEEKGKKKPLNFICHYMANIYIARNSDGEVDTVYRTFEYTARQAMQEFKDHKKTLGDKIVDAFESSKKKDKKFRFIHAVMPREDADPSKDDPISMPWASIWVNRGEKTLIYESGYPEMPYQVTIFDGNPQEDYGRSATMKKLPDIKMAGHMKKARIKGWEKQVDPSMIVPDDGSIWPLATQVGGVIYKRAGSEDPTWFEFKGDMNKMEEAILSVKQDIQRGYFLDMFDPLVDRQNMTATEVMARIEQKMRFLTPIIGRLQSEFFNPMIHRVIGILGRQGLLPEMPEVLENKEVSVMYLGRLALALRTLESEGLAQLLLEWAPMAEVSDHFDNLNTDVAFRDSSRNRGVPATWINNIAERKKIRDNRAQAEQAANLLDQIPDLSKAAKNLSSKPEEGSITEGVMDAA